MNGYVMCLADYTLRQSCSSELPRFALLMKHVSVTGYSTVYYCYTFYIIIIIIDSFITMFAL